ncbi:TIGR04283 family arsenosugar biosynthesis glycosyltransferase [Thiohalobacter thiocyanaticus]|uniref:Glycosyltransferase n=1 Tax=Thiohalobacter thiocyanaticus TaxID=585455 RepID=A0A426QG98_9GAMM|nr:TIGR04283 family arsenosugar biosynthesis glycosyltransferase [Thiohalobacter thiocyanaticus]RRQ20778.1 glycosyltransferase [Thiohalobacter thiocyanaticus]
MADRLSIIIPALNEAAGIGALLAALQPLRTQGHELILVDGGSRDATVELARPQVDVLLQSAPGRARQMNAGARAARGDILWFVHADTGLDAGHAGVLLRSLEDNPGRAWGRFDVRITGNSPLLGMVARLMNLRSRLSGIATGDQGIFVRRAAFMEIGGYPDQPLMEDIEFSKSLKHLSPPLCLRQCIETSGRRWEQGGVVRTVVLMWGLRLGYFLGLAPERLARLYN